MVARWFRFAVRCWQIAGARARNGNEDNDRCMLHCARSGVSWRLDGYPGFGKREKSGAAVLLSGKLTRESAPRNAVAIDRRTHARRFDEQREHLVFTGSRLVLRHLDDERRAQLIPG